MGRPRFYPTPRRVDVATPAVATGWTRRNDSGGMWIVRSLAFRLVTDANVANRFVSISATAGEDVWFRTVVQVAHTAGLTVDYSAWAGGHSSTVLTSVGMLAWPGEGLWLPPGHDLAAAVAGIQAGDQLSACFLQVIELPEVLPANLMPMVTTFTEEDGI